MQSFNTGWSQLNWEQLSNYNLNIGLKKSDCFYFNHGYMFPDNADIAGKIVYDISMTVPSLYFNNNLCGIQFHPEKSQLQGVRILKNILTKYYDL